MSTKEVTTPHGQVEYETVECSSCGQEIRKEDAYHFAIGNVYSERNRHGRLRVEYKRDTKPVQGYACEYCASEGPIGFPYLNTLDRIRRFKWWFTDRHGPTMRGGVIIIILIVLIAIGAGVVL